jgi:hypothetical protein
MMKILLERMPITGRYMRRFSINDSGKNISTNPGIVFTKAYQRPRMWEPYKGGMTLIHMNWSRIFGTMSIVPYAI